MRRDFRDECGARFCGKIGGHVDIVFSDCRSRLEEGKDSVIAVITKVKGSAPRHKGSFMLVGEEGRISGTIGGGKIEYDMIALARKCLEERKNATAEVPMMDLGEMICGGEVRVLCMYVAAQEKDNHKAWIDRLEQLEQSGENAILRMPYAGGGPEVLSEKEVNKMQLHAGAGSMDGCNPASEESLQYFEYRFQTDGKIYVFGAGHVVWALVPVLAGLGYECIVCDDRTDVLETESIRTYASEIRAIDYKNFELDAKTQDYIVVATRGHQFDLDVMRVALKTDAGYIGVLGSRKKSAVVRGVLQQEGFSDENIERMISPIGLDIGSETPQEIAISIAAQIIQKRRSTSKH